MMMKRCYDDSYESGGECYQISDLQFPQSESEPMFNHLLHSKVSWVSDAEWTRHNRVMSKQDHTSCRRMKRRILSNIKSLLNKRLSMKTFHNKPKSLQLDLDKNGREERVENVYVQVNSIRTSNIRFKPDISECASCYFGDPVLTCTCSFRHQAPDFKLYEDDEQFLNNFDYCNLHTKL